MTVLIHHRRTAMSSLADFYGIAASDEPAGVEDQQQVAAAEKQREDGRVTLESEQFDSQSYLRSLLAHKSMRDLIHHDNAMIASKRALDSEMQTLVYDNYNKFISATDMIRKMKTNVESMETQMASLLTNMNDISKSCQNIEADLTPNRAKVENLLGTSRLLKRLEFLFELPEKLRTSVRLGAYEQAVRYFRISSSILDQYKHHRSFQHIQVESEQIIGDLKATLRGLIKDPTLSSEQQMSYTAMLVLDLAEPDSPQLMSDLIEQQRKRFQAQMNKAVDLASRATAAFRKGSVSEHKSDSDDSPTAVSTSAPDSNLLALLHQHFIMPYVLFADTFLSTLVRPYEIKQQKLQQMAEQLREENALAGKGKSASTGPTSSSVASAVASLQHLTQSLALSQDSLTRLSVDLFNAYFTLARRELLKRASISPSADASQLILQFTGTLKSFYDGLSKPLLLLPRAKLADRAQEIVHHALTHCVEAVCEHALAGCVTKLADTHSQVLAWRPGGVALATPATVSMQLRKTVEASLSLLVVVLSTREYLPESVAAGLSFAELARAHATQLLRHLAREIAYGTPRRADGPVYDTQPASALSVAIESRLSKRGAGVGSERDARTPLFYLFLCQLAAQQESKDIPAVLKTLSKFFPPPPPMRGRAKETDTILPDLMAKAKESTQGLLLRYCETHGFQVTEIVRTSLLSQGASGEPRHPSDFVDRLQQHLHRVSLELGMIFPKSREEAVHDRNHDSSGRDLLGARTSAARSHLNKDNKPGSALSRGGGGINRDIQRLFTEKIATFSGVEADGVISELTMDRTHPMWAICKIAFKAMMETTRMERLSVGAYHQLQLDVFTVRAELPSFLPEASMDVCKVLHVLLDETLNSAQERAPNAAPNAAPIDEHVIADTYDASRAQRPPTYTQEAPADSAAATDGVLASSGAASFYSATAASSSSTQPTGALARLVLSSSNATDAPSATDAH